MVRKDTTQMQLDGLNDGELCAVNTGPEAQRNVLPPPLTREQMRRLEEDTLAEIERECADNPYHKTQHTREVIERVTFFAEHVPSFTAEDRQLLRIAALFHDFRHAGRTIRQTGQYNQADPATESNEELAARIAGERLAGILPASKIIQVQFLILGTTFGQDSKMEWVGEALGRNYKAVTPMEKTLAFVDVAGYLKTFKGWMDESMNVFREMPLARLPKDFDAMIKGRKFFAGTIIRGQLKELKDVLDPLYYNVLDGYLDAIVGTEDGKVLADDEERIIGALNEPAQIEKYRAEFDEIRAKALAA